MELNCVEALRNGEERALSQIYNEHRAPFFKFASRYGLDPEEAADIYQDAFLAIRKHALSGRLDSVASSFKTYLFGIGKFMLLERLRATAQQTTLTPAMLPADESVQEIRVTDEPPLTREQQLLHENFKKLGKSCQRVLTLFYSRGLTIEEIVVKEGYDNAGVVKSHKSRCLKSLRQLISGDNHKRD